jgi:hypothetical protein
MKTDLTLVPARNELNDLHLECVASGKDTSLHVVEGDPGFPVYLLPVW